MAKDPAFLFYSKDWIEGTAEMTSEEKGVYIDLLAHQHQKGDLPKETNRLCKLSGLSESDFLPIWGHLKSKFETNSVDRLVNRKLTDVTTERSDKGLKNKVVSVLGIVVRECKRSQNDKFEAKKGFKVDEFLGLQEPKLTESITKWFYDRLPTLEDGNGNGNEDANENIILDSKYLIPEMLKKFQNKNSTYVGDIQRDFKPLGSISAFIQKTIGMNGDTVKNKDAILSEWGLMCDIIVDDSFYRTKSLSVISNQIQEIYQIRKNGKRINGNNGNNGSTAVKKSGVSTDRVEKLRNYGR